MEHKPCIRSGEHDTISEVRGLPAFHWSVEISDSKGLRRFALKEGSTLLIGSSSQADVRLEDPTVSGFHGELGVQKGQLWVRDVGSRNGIHVAGARVEQATFLRGGCFVLGRSLVQVSPGDLEREDFSREPPLEGVVGRSQAMLRLAREVRRCAPLRASVLIRGETGTGKELIAEALHRQSSRASGPFLPLNMGALAPELVDSELFGHEKGAFTGAVVQHQGAFATAHGGTLFLDEVVELPMSAQAKLLRVLENGEVKPVGSAQVRKVNVRVVAASWACLQERVTRGQFREDLFHRLAVLTIQVPPLRERFGDLALLATHFLERMASEVGEKHLTSGALSRLSCHSWPGNVRELKNVLLRAALMSPEPWIGTEQINASLMPFRYVPSRDEQAHIREAKRLLEVHEGNVSSAARAMGVARSTFRGWLRQGNAG
ncbi:MAG: sigma 54-interacting transcriptional regulator [Myxococcales bacterium]|nr:sigma 54-interacting transcriptional regulator [Polyangiaceae bacterium]MDW8250176.1 sigma 54-interacting transcriptional regulator [Myxococcales bacterium]